MSIFLRLDFRPIYVEDKFINIKIITIFILVIVILVIVKKMFELITTYIQESKLSTLKKC